MSGLLRMVVAHMRESVPDVQARRRSVVVEQITRLRVDRIMLEEKHAREKAALDRQIETLRDTIIN